MSDLISRRALMKEFADFVKRSNNSDFAPAPTWNDAVSLVGSMPSAQPEIIRCKDCKHWCNHKWLNIPWCREMHIDRGAEDFCSDAERKEVDDVKAELEEAPTVDVVVRKKGKWVWLSRTNDRSPCEMRFWCSECHHETIVHTSGTSEPWEHYCPNCGAEMEKGAYDE